jgi:hypothetical protein
MKYYIHNNGPNVNVLDRISRARRRAIAHGGRMAERTTLTRKSSDEHIGHKLGVPVADVGVGGERAAFELGGPFADCSRLIGFV